MTTSWPKKDPDERLDFSIDWRTEGRLPLGDKISESVWISPVGITVETDSFNDDIATIWLSGGTVGQSYDFTNRITTLAGRIMDKTVRLKIKER